jgi:iron complex transport system substrate-binding protein
MRKGRARLSVAAGLVATALVASALVLVPPTSVGAAGRSVESRPDAGQKRVIKDDLGHKWTLGPPPQRIISLAPNVTEILFALGLGDRVVGVTRYCDYPDEALTKTKIGGWVDPSIEQISVLKPDLVLAFRGNPVRTIEKMRSLGFPVFGLEPGTSFESLLETIGKIGLVTGSEKSARALIATLAARIKEIEAPLRDLAERPKVFLSLQGPGLWTCGRDSFLDGLIRRAGGVNIAGEIDRKWVLLSREEILYQDPDFVVIMSKTEPDFERAADWFRNEPRLQHLTAVEAGRIRRLDENKASRFGPRLVDAFQELVRLIHPELTGEAR